MPFDEKLPHILYLNGEAVPLLLRESARAKRLHLKVDPAREGPVVTAPKGYSRQKTLDFVDKNRGWLEQKWAKLPRRIHFEEGTVLPVLGQEVELRLAPEARRGVWREEGALWVSGRREHLARRVTDYLKAEVKQALLAKVREKVALLPSGDHRPLGRVTVRDTSSRWGSCSVKGDLSFSWRVVFAPPFVLDYLVAHEVSHLVHMNHSASFWRQVAAICDEDEAGRRWLSRDGARLQRYG
ncbi:M48 family metallopeptidase [Rhodovibrionaceae bacterium A322]